MKRFILLFIFISLVFCFIGCSDNDSGDESFAPPSNIVVEYDITIDDYLVTWTHSENYLDSDFDGYNVYVSDTIVIDLSELSTSQMNDSLVSTNSYSIDADEIELTGRYLYVLSVRDDGLLSDLESYVSFEHADRHIAPPTLLRLFTITTGNDLHLSWISDSIGIDGFHIYFNGDLIGNSTECTFVHEHASQTGVYEVKSYRGGIHSDPATASSEAYTGTSGNIYCTIDPPADHPSGIGWGATGVHSHYSVSTDNYNYINMMLDADMDIISPDLEIEGGNVTWFKMTTGTPEPPLPVNDTNYGTCASTDVGDAAWFVINDGTTFGKIQIITRSDIDHYVQIAYKIQLIDNFSIVE